MAQNIKRTVAVLASAAALVLTGAATAQAQPSASAEGKGQHCVLNVATEQETCFGTAAQAADYAKSGQSSTARGKEFRWVQLAVVNTDFFFRGSSYTFVGPNGCRDGNAADYVFDLPAQFVNRVYSLQPFSNCWLDLFTGPQASGWSSHYRDATPAVPDPWRVNAASLTLG
ncbi:hypothetical protein [Streptomyces clavuligerus]|uniref:Secreted protein n=1 Tax=Streptomyces clavuligerus TaxID=1901 RepID=E2Q600_STRCL|nr:hypothetical protein [Streptomyces clavuligerus]ANW21658.1 hypothetical protein BB341_27320 [Streptomyces clavuligerus]AXU16286.1 hypothetical protein D1794_28390 [Streptomyces clavuligerus]EFG05160.1 Hypothetical protein SCLAV_0084 [Streptomyces clavuligerus]MBY6306446.1 hypothetical protein [Streptomyces clavuligerus]QCS09065.1 hypothetical protein CRV15_27745 [Streptomyces clavuligerus]